jgi:hypothetical protein
MLGRISEKLEHNISKGYGTTKTTYISTVEKLLYGIGQGRCSSPLFWKLLNQLIMKSLRKKSSASP